MPTLCHNSNPIINDIEIKLIHTRTNLNNVLNQNDNMTKRERFATFAINILDNLRLRIRINGTQSKYDCQD